MVDDDKDLAGLVSMHLKEAGYQVALIHNGDEGLKTAMSDKHDLLILDLNLPGLGGMEICKSLRTQRNNTPILMLTSKSEEIDKVLGLELGADDYMTKPFSVRELVARVNALLRRSGAAPAEEKPAGPDKKSTINIGELSIDIERRKVTLDEKPVELTATEFDLLSHLASNAGRPFNRDQLLSSVWGYQFAGYEHTVNSHINRLRAKIEKDPSKPRFIITVWGVGYRFAENSEL
jgi:DNA-binding response OmpR family regulator